MNLTKAILSLRPGAQWMLRDEHYAGLEWIDTEQTKPTEAELEVEIARLQSVYEANEYQRLRAAEYPPMAEQLDMIFHNGIDAWKEQIQAVKDKYPKG
jgi:predicted lipoprotein